MARICSWLAVGICGAIYGTASAQEFMVDGDRTVDLTELSLEELVNLPVTSVSRKSERAFEAPAAIHVITSEDIRRSGVTSIPEALRLAPGVQVGRVGAGNWAISARGFNDQFANKLLVLMDGRSVYTPLYSGVYWDVQDTMLEDIDRIEVIRGPGATLWGANAVNGVINILTKHSRDTQGALVSGGGGSELNGFANFRHGGQLSENAYYRVYSKYALWDESVLSGGAGGQDAWNSTRGGFRVDWDPSDQSAFTLQGDVYSGSADQVFTLSHLTLPYDETQRGVTDFSGANLLGRWTRSFSPESELRVQTYYDRTDRGDRLLSEERNTFDFDAQHRFEAGARQQIIWGVGYRASVDEIGNSDQIMLDPGDRTTQLGSFFVQDEISLVPDRLRLTLGSKFEHNSFTGFEVQPSGRLSWTPHPRHAFWSSVSRAVRTPSRVESDGMLRIRVDPPSAATGGLPVAYEAHGHSGYDSETLVAYELGYRVQPIDRVSLDLALFYNEYDDLRSLEQQPTRLETDPTPHFVVPLQAGNRMYGESYGVELAANYHVSAPWRLQASYSFIQMQLHLKPGSTDPLSTAAERQTPHHQFGLRSFLDLPRHLELDAGIRYVDNLPGHGIPSYVVLDARIGWRPAPNWELSLVGRNWLENQHPEFPGSELVRTRNTEVQHSIHGSVTWMF